MDQKTAREEEVRLSSGGGTPTPTDSLPRPTDPTPRPTDSTPRSTVPTPRGMETIRLVCVYLWGAVCKINHKFILYL